MIEQKSKTNSNFTNNKIINYFIFLFIISIPIQSVSILGRSEDGTALKIYNIIFVLITLAILPKYRTRTLDQVSGSMSRTNLEIFIIFIFLLLYFSWISFSGLWAEDQTKYFSMLAKYFFVFIEFIIFAFLFSTNKGSFEAFRTSFEISGFALTIILIFTIFKKGLLDFVVAETSISPNAKNEYFGNIGLGFAGGKNLLGSWLAIATFLLFSHIYEIWKLNYNIKKFLLTIALLTTSCGLALTISRTAIIGLAASGIIFLLFNNKKFLKYLVLGLFIFGITSTVFLYITSDNMIIEKLQGTGSETDTGAAARKILWSIAASELSNSPIGGKGLGNGIQAIKKYPSPLLDEEDNYHNLYIQNASDLGIVGLFLFLLFLTNLSGFTLLTIFSKSYESAKKNLVTIFSIFCGYLIMSFFQYKGADPEIWLLFGAMFGETIRIKKNAKKTHHSKNHFLKSPTPIIVNQVNT